MATEDRFATDLILRLQSRPARDLRAQFPRHAVVGIAIRGSEITKLEILFIQRATHAQDRWSGQIAFPGGHAEKNETDLQALQREFSEELSTSVPQVPVARLDDLQARKAGVDLALRVRPMLTLAPESTIQPNLSEVAAAFYWPLQELLSDSRQTQHQVQYDSLARSFPAVDVGRGVPLWGLSYLIVEDLLTRLLQEKYLTNYGAFRPWRSTIENSQER